MKVEMEEEISSTHCKQNFVSFLCLPFKPQVIPLQLARFATCTIEWNPARLESFILHGQVEMVKVRLRGKFTVEKMN